MSKLLRLRRGKPSFAAVIALVALALAIEGIAVAVPSAENAKEDKNEVDLFVATGGPVETVSPKGGPPEDGGILRTPIPLANAAFTQRAGEAVLLAAHADMTPHEGTQFCGVEVGVTLDGAEGEAGIFLVAHTNKGELGEAAASELLTAPAVDTARTLRAFAREEEGCDGDDELGGGPDTWTVSLHVTVVTVRP